MKKDAQLQNVEKERRVMINEIHRVSRMQGGVIMSKQYLRKLSYKQLRSLFINCEGFEY